MFKVLLKYLIKLILLSGEKIIYILMEIMKKFVWEKKYIMNDIYKLNNLCCKYVVEEYILWDIYIIFFFVK